MAKICSANVEEIAVGAVKEAIARSEFMKPNIVTNDKFESWDGTISLYSNNKCRKCDLIDRIDVQVKGKTVKKFHENSWKYSMEIADLNNYFNAGGTVLFVVEIDENFNKSIYYNAMAPIDLLKYIEKGKDNKTIGVDVKKLPDSPKKIWFILRNHLQEKNSQHRKVILKNKDIEEYECLAIDIIAEPTEVDNFLLENNFAVYAITKAQEKIPLSDRINISQIIKKNKISVRVGEKEYYGVCEQIKSKNSCVIKFGGISINLDTNEIIGNIEGTIKNVINDMEFIINAIELGYVEINNKKYLLSKRDEEKRKRIIESLSSYKIINNMFEYFGVDFDVDIRTLNENDIQIINSLLNLYGNVKKDVNEFGVKKVKIANVNFEIIILPSEGKGYRVENYFGNFYRTFRTFFDNNGQELETTVYSLLKAEDIIELVNFNPDSVIDSIKRIPVTEINYGIVTNILLEVIKAFDIIGQERIYNLACDINEYLITCDANDIINKLNRYQIVKRKRDLTKDEKNELYKLKEIQERIEILVGMSIVLENKSDFEYYFEKMSLEEQNTFRNYPIYELAKRRFNL